MRFAAFWDERTAATWELLESQTHLSRVDQGGHGRRTGRGRREFPCPEGQPSPRIRPNSNKAHAEWKFKDFTWKQRSGVMSWGGDPTKMHRSLLYAFNKLFIPRELKRRLSSSLHIHLTVFVVVLALSCQNHMRTFTRTFGKWPHLVTQCMGLIS